MINKLKIAGFAFIIFLSVQSTLFAETLGGIKSTSFITGGTVNGPTIVANDFYDGVANIGDLDADGVIDIAVGTYGDDTVAVRTGAVHISYLNADGTVKSTVKITTSTLNGPTLIANDQYGFPSSVSGIGDLDNDGIPDLAVGAFGDDTGGSGRGAFYIHYMNRNGSIKSTVKIASGTTNGPTLIDGDAYGISIANLGDIDADGIQDLAVGAFSDDTGGSGRGAFYIHYMNRNGSIKSTVKIASGTTNGPTLADNDIYIYVNSIGDLDNDGITDLAVGTPGDDTGGSARGAFYIHYMNSGGSIKSTVKIASGTTNGPTLADGDTYGAYVTNLGDMDGDGIQDLAVGATQDDTGGGNYGAFYIHYMNRDGSIKSTVKIASGTTNGPTLIPSNAGVQYGRGIASLGDLNSDGAIDIAVGAELDTYTGGPGSNGQYGRVFIHFMQPVNENRLTKTTLGVVEGGSTDTFNVSLKSKPTSDVTVAIASGRGQITSNSPTLTFTSVNWNTPQTVTVSAVNDTDYENGHADTLTLTDTSIDSSYNNLTNTLNVSIGDNDSAITSSGSMPTQAVSTPAAVVPGIITQVSSAPTLQQPSAIKFVITKLLKQGSNNSEVLLLQQFLNNYGFVCGVADGKFGSKTKECVKVFQKENSLTPDGAVGPKTREGLYSLARQG